MSFARPHLLWFLLVVPPAMALFFWWSARARRKLMAQFIQARLLPGLVLGVSPKREKFRAVILILAAALLILALARPQWGYDMVEVKQRGLDIVVAIDTSKSMLAEDIAPNRLARAKLAALDLMQQAKLDRLGLVAFAGGAFLQCPLTIDDTAFQQAVESLDVNTLPQGGTAIAEAIDTAAKAFKEGDNYKVLVLFTDGEDHDSGAVDAAKKAAKDGLRIFTIGIGSAKGELLRVKNENGQSDYVRDENGNIVMSRLNENLLREIAGDASGFYLPLRGANTIDMLYQRGLAPLPKSESEEKWIRRPHERFYWPLGLAIVLLAAEMFFPERKNERNGRVSGRRSTENAATEKSKSAATVAAIFGLLIFSSAAFASPSGALREYKSGNYGAALKDYEQSLEKQKNDDPRLHFNAGAAAYRDGKFDQAAKHFDQAIISPDLKLQEQAYYNLGNTLYQLGEQNPDPSKRSETWEESLQKYENSLKLNPQDTDAKFNHDFVKRQLEKLKKQQQQQQQNSKQDQSKKDQNSKQNQQQKQQSKNDQQKQNESKSDQQKQQKQNSSEQQKKDEAQKNQEQQKKSDESQEKKNQAQQQQKQQQSGQQKNSKNGGEKGQQQSYAPGEMTPQQAKQLLDSQKGDEKLLPANPERQNSDQQTPVKDW
jgi:Ca-activated chloride channel family protein